MKRDLTLDPAKAALLCIDLQEEHRGDPRYLVEGFDRVLSNVARLQSRARAAGVQVVHAAYIVDRTRMRPFHPVMEDGTSAFSDESDPLTALCPEIGPQRALRSWDRSGADARRRSFAGAPDRR